MARPLDEAAGRGGEPPLTLEPAARRRQTVANRQIRVLSVFGTRPEVIKFMPVLRELERRSRFRTVNVLTSQHVDLVRPLLRQWQIRIDHDLERWSPVSL